MGDTIPHIVSCDLQIVCETAMHLTKQTESTIYLRKRVIGGVFVCMDGRTDGQADGRTDGRMDGWVGECSVRWMYKCTQIHIYMCICIYIYIYVFLKYISHVCI